MNAAKYTTQRLPSFAAVLLAFAAALPAVAAENPAIRIEDGTVEPLAGRDYSMRIDVAASRFERYDAASDRVELIDFDARGARTLAPGLWLAVPQPGSAAVALLPLGTNPSAAAANVAILDLPAAVVARIRDDGGVIYVDGGGRVAAATRDADARVAEATPGVR